MAHGPTHRGGGGHSFGGHHSSGGHHHSSGSYRSSSHYRHTPPPPPPNPFWFFGRRNVVVVHNRRTSVTASISGFLVIVIVLAIIIAVAVSGSIPDSRAQIKYMEEDSIEYYDSIERALNGEDGYYIINATITGYDDYSLYYNGEYYFMIKYTFFNKNTNRWNDGCTYYSYTETDIDKKGLKTGSTIQIVYYGFEGDSIDLEYKLENADYLKYKQDIKNSTTCIVVCVFVVIGCVAILILMAKIALSINKSRESTPAYESTSTTTTTNQNTYTTNQNTYTTNQNTSGANEKKCPYCGYIITDEKKCPCCGANVKY